MDCISDNITRRITLMWSAQQGKTEGLLNNPIGYFISHDPKSVIAMHPTERDLQAWVNGKLNPLLNDTPQVKGTVAKPRGREGVNNQIMKSFPGGFLYLVYSGSASQLAGKSAPIILCDEIDRYSATEEGDAVQLLWQRAATFGDQRKLIETSTPTIKGESAIEKAFEAGDQRYRWLPCPCCDEMQKLVWAQVKWEKDANGDHLAESAYYECEHCGHHWDDGDKLAAIQHGEWRAEKPFFGHASFHLNELHSPFRRWADIVQSFLDKKAADSLQTFVNVSLAETWDEQGEKVEPHLLAQRREPYRNPPAGVLCITAGVDVQDDRLEIEVVGWGKGHECWGLDTEIFRGDPGRRELWDQLAAYMANTWQREDGARLQINAAFVDTAGHYTQQAYDFVKPLQGRRVFGIVGRGGEGRPPVSRPSTNNKGKVQLFTIGVDTIKEHLILSALRVSQVGAGYCHFPSHYDDEYFEQLTAEKQVTRYVSGYPKRQWKKMRARNEALDLRVYATAARIMLNPQYESLERALVPSHIEAESLPETNTQPEKPKRKRRRVKSSMVKNW